MRDSNRVGFLQSPLSKIAAAILLNDTEIENCVAAQLAELQRNWSAVGLPEIRQWITDSGLDLTSVTEPDDMASNKKD